MDQRPTTPMPGQTRDPATQTTKPSRATPASADPVTAAQLREPVEPVLAGRVPDAMDGAVGVHDGSARAGEATWSTSQGAGGDLETDLTEGRASTADDRGQGSTRLQGRPADDRESAMVTGREVQLTTDPKGTIDAALDDEVVALLDLPRWTEHLRALPSWRDGDRASSLLLRQPPVRVLLSALRQDAELGSEGAQETVMLLVLSGAATIEWRGEVARIGEGELVVVPAGGGWRVASNAPESVLLSTFWGTPGTGEADDSPGSITGVVSSEDTTSGTEAGR